MSVTKHRASLPRTVNRATLKTAGFHAHLQMGWGRVWPKRGHWSEGGTCSPSPMEEWQEMPTMAQMSLPHSFQSHPYASSWFPQSADPAEGVVGDEARRTG